jgi:hypothetical protein
LIGSPARSTPARAGGCKVVNKQYKGRRIFGRLGDVSQAEAEAWLKDLQDKIDPCLFAVNTGAPEENICGLRWERERKIKELGRSIFMVPGTATKNSEPFSIAPNDVAMNVIDSCRGDHKDYVFVYTDEKRGWIQTV